MIAIRKLTANEAVHAFPKRGQIDLTDYLEALQSLNVGDSAEVELSGITRRALKRRIGMAARQLGATIKWSRFSDDDTLIFQIRDVAPVRARRTRRPRTNGQSTESPSRRSSGGSSTRETEHADERELVGAAN